MANVESSKDLLLIIKQRILSIEHNFKGWSVNFVILQCRASTFYAMHI